MVPHVLFRCELSLPSPLSSRRHFDKAAVMLREISRQSLQPMDELVQELSRPRVDHEKETHRRLMRTVSLSSPVGRGREGGNCLSYPLTPRRR